jgi:hypothetical protein
LADEQREFWSEVAQRYDRVADLQIGPATRGLVRDRLARETRLGAGNVTFQAEDAQKTSFPDAIFDTAFMSLVMPSAGGIASSAGSGSSIGASPATA